jgi:hypothetical protein
VIFKLCATLISAQTRSFLARKKFCEKKERCERLQIAIRAWLRNRYLLTSLERLHHTCTVGQGRELASILTVPSAENQQIVNGKYCAEVVPYTTFHLREVLSIRYRQRDFATILQVAISTGNLSVVKALSPGPTDILAKDKAGNAAAHYVSLYPSVDIIEQLSDALAVRYLYSELLACGVLGEEPAGSAPSPTPMRKLFGRRGSFLALEDDSDDEGTGGQEAVSHQLNEKLAAVVTGDCIRQGMLKKVQLSPPSLPPSLSSSR